MSTPLDGLKALLKNAFDVAVNAVIASAVTALPILGVPGINFVFKWAVKWVAGKLYPYIDVFLADRVIEIQVEAEKKAYINAREELRTALKKHIRDPKEIQNASDDFDKRLSDLIKIKL